MNQLYVMPVGLWIFLVVLSRGWMAIYVVDALAEIPAFAAGSMTLGSLPTLLFYVSGCYFLRQKWGLSSPPEASRTPAALLWGPENISLMFS